MDVPSGHYGRTIIAALIKRHATANRNPTANSDLGRDDMPGRQWATGKAMSISPPPDRFFAHAQEITDPSKTDQKLCVWIARC